MSWIDTAGVLAVALAVTLAPGALIALAVGVRGFRILAYAAPFTLAAVGAAALADQVLPFDWGILPIIISTLVIAGASWAVRRIILRRGTADATAATPGSGAWALPLAAAAVASALIVPRLLSAIGSPTNISQTFDNVYHLNAVRYIVDTGIASPMQQLIPGFYPDSWHALTSAVVLLTGAEIPVAVNVVTVVLGAVVWPLGCLVLVATILGPRPIVLFGGAVVSAAFAGFPLLMMDFGVLYPNVLSIALLPAVLAMIVAVVFPAADSLQPGLRIWTVLMAVPALALAHPSTLMGLIAMIFPLAVILFVRHLRWASARTRRVGAFAAVVAGWAVAAVAVAFVLLRARPTFAQAFWPPTTDLWDASLDVLLGSVLGKPAAITLALLLTAGIIAAFVLRRHRWTIASFAIIAGLYVVCVAFPAGSLRYWLTGTWYSDAFRIAALLPVVALPVATLGLVWLAGLVTSVIARLASGRRELAAGVAAATAIVLVVGVASQLEPSLGTATRSAAASYSMSDRSALLTSDERALLKRVSANVPEDAVIAGSPWTGTSLAYTYADREALIPHIYSAWDADIETIVNRLRDGDDDPAVCEALRRTQVQYVLDFGRVEVHGARHEYPGFEGLGNSDVATLRDQQGDARLYEITACA